MSVVTLSATDFANFVRLYTCVIMPVAIQGFLYAVPTGSDDKNIYRVAIA